MVREGNPCGTLLVIKHLLHLEFSLSILFCGTISVFLYKIVSTQYIQQDLNKFVISV